MAYKGPESELPALDKPKPTTPAERGVWKERLGTADVTSRQWADDVLARLIHDADAQDDPFWDATDGAHPAWWRAHDFTSDVFAAKVTAWLRGDEVEGRGLREPWGSIRTMLLGLVKMLETKRTRMFPIQQGPSVPWAAAERAYATYAARYGTYQSLERLAERGGFGRQEYACYFAGHTPVREHQGCIEKADSLALELVRLIQEAKDEREARAREGKAALAVGQELLGATREIEAMRRARGDGDTARSLLAELRLGVIDTRPAPTPDANEYDMRISAGLTRRIQAYLARTSRPGAASAEPGS